MNRSGIKSESEAGRAFAGFEQKIPVPESVSRNLRLYHDMLVKWQRRFNLVSNASLEDAWSRHFLDCAQIFRLLEDQGGPCVDMGTGAGFPGLVLAIMGARDVRLVDSDANKTAFLRQVILKTGVDAKVHPCRLEKYDGPSPRVVVSRACAALTDLLAYTDAIREKPSKAVFLKGKTWYDELTRAERVWHIDYERHPSLTDANGMILEIHDFYRR